MGFKNVEMSINKGDMIVYKTRKFILLSFVCENLWKSLTEIIKVKLKKRFFFFDYYDNEINNTFKWLNLICNRQYLSIKTVIETKMFYVNKMFLNNQDFILKKVTL